MIDILQKVYKKEITEDEADDIMDDVIEKHDTGELDVDPQEELNMDVYEWTAFALGASFEKIAKWRYEGWPNRCKCGKEFDYKEAVWVIEDDELTVLDCCDD